MGSVTGAGRDGSDPAMLGAVEAARLFADRKLSPSELTEACLARIAAREPEIRAWAFLDPELPRQAARALDGKAPAGPLHGLPIGVKDIIATRDMPTASGSPIYEGHRPIRDAACVAASRASGGVVLGKTTTTEFAAYTPTKTRNPRNTGHTPGGSSAGSAAAVADGMVPLAFGTQTAGSIIRPASFNGVVGYKPTYGTIEIAGITPFADSLDTLGVFARSVPDAALFAGAAAGWPAMAAIPLAEKPRRVRVVRGPKWELATAEIDGAVESAARAFEANGVTVEDLELPEDFDDLVVIQDLLQIYEGRRALTQECAEDWERLSEGLRVEFERAATHSFEDYWKARQAQQAWIARMDAMIEPGDLLLTASAPGEAPEGLGSTGNGVFCRAWSLLHTPAISLPHGTGPAGLPLGIQLIGARWRDLDLLAAARFLEDALS